MITNNNIDKYYY